MRIIKGELKKLKSINISRLKNKSLDTINGKLGEYSSLLKITIDNEGLEEADIKKQEFIRSLRNMLESIQEMNLVEYLEHLKEISDDKDNKEDKNQSDKKEINKKEEFKEKEKIDDKIDNMEVEQKIIDLMDMKNVDKHIRYKIRF